MFKTKHHTHDKETTLTVTGFLRVLAAILIGCLLFWSSPTAGLADDGFRAIFDGKTLDGWTGEPGRWRV